MRELPDKGTGMTTLSSDRKKKFSEPLGTLLVYFLDYYMKAQIKSQKIPITTVFLKKLKIHLLFEFAFFQFVF